VALARYLRRYEQVIAPEGTYRTSIGVAAGSYNPASGIENTMKMPGKKIEEFTTLLPSNPTGMPKCSGRVG